MRWTEKRNSVPSFCAGYRNSSTKTPGVLTQSCITDYSYTNYCTCGTPCLPVPLNRYAGCYPVINRLFNISLTISVIEIEFWILKYKDTRDTRHIYYSQGTILLQEFLTRVLRSCQSYLLHLRSDSHRLALLPECKGNRSEEPMVGLADLVEGAAYFYLGNVEAAIKSYRNCLKCRYPSKDEYDQHVSAFALYELGSSLCNNNVSTRSTHPTISRYKMIKSMLYLRFRISTKARDSYWRRKRNIKTTTSRVGSTCAYTPPWEIYSDDSVCKRPILNSFYIEGIRLTLMRLIGTPYARYFNHTSVSTLKISTKM